jgi:DNA-directed RNA polymerase specialized sigma24 family protein
MPYVTCPACGLRFHAVAAHSTVVRCPKCDVDLARDGRPAPAATGGGGVVEAALESHAVVLLIFFVRRALEAEAGIALWAETVAQAHLAAHRLATTSEAVAWLDAMAYRQLARYRAGGRPDGRGLRRLGLGLPQPGAAEILDVDLLADLPRLRALAEHALATLPERGREIVRLRVVERRSAKAPASGALEALPALRAWLRATPDLRVRARPI